MTRSPIRVLLPLAMLAFTGLTAACGDDDPVSPPVETDLSGTYELVSLTQAGVTIGPPVATGTLVATQTTYSIDLTVPDPDNPMGPGVNTVDSGTYSTNGDGWTQESSNTGLQGVGTFSLQGGTLTVDVTTAGIEVLTVWSSTD